MTDPLPENIDGKKIVTYENKIHHNIHWGYVAVGIGILVAAYVVHQKWSDDDQGDQTGI